MPAPAVIAAGAAVLQKILDIIDKSVPDKDQAEQAKAEATRLFNDGALQRDLGNIDINRIEATSPNVFVAGWRPFIGWACGIGVLWNLLLQPLLAWFSGMGVLQCEPPPLADPDLLLTLVAILLGVAGLRTFEKVKGVARE